MPYWAIYISTNVFSAANGREGWTADVASFWIAASATSGGRPLTRLDRRARLFAATLAAVAGYVDGVGFLITGGYFVSFMSGNSTRLGVSLFPLAPDAAFAASLVAAFITGVVGGSSIRRFGGRRPETAILAALTADLALCGYLASVGAERATALLLAAAMGAENTIFAEAGEVRFGVTYMTGTLVKIGKGVAAALFGEAPLRWALHLVLWLGLVAGAASGATAYGRLGARAIWLAAVAVAILTPVSVKIFPLAGAGDEAELRGARSST